MCTPAGHPVQGHASKVTCNYLRQQLKLQHDSAETDYLISNCWKGTYIITNVNHMPCPNMRTPPLILVMALCAPCQEAINAALSTC